MFSNASADILAEISYIKWSPLFETEKPFHIFIPIPKDAKDQRQTNVDFEAKQTIIRDIRGQEAKFDLDNNGICFRHHKSAFNDFENIEAVQREHLPEIERILKSEVEGADKIYFFNWRLRTSRDLDSGTVINLSNPTNVMRPSIHAHIDQAPSGALHNVLNYLPEEAEELLKGRVRIINVWRPCRNTIENWPLVFCDGGDVTYNDLLETDHVQQTTAGPSMNLLHRPGREWFYLNRQTRDEIAIFKNFDSSYSAKARFAPHASFQIPGSSPKSIRDSIEVRALVFTLA